MPNLPKPAVERGRVTSAPECRHEDIDVERIIDALHPLAIECGQPIAHACILRQRSQTGAARLRQVFEPLIIRKGAPIMPLDTLLPYKTMAHNNAWANHRLLTACAALSQEEFTAPRAGFFPSLRATLNHNLIVDHFYVDAMEGGTLGTAAWDDREPCTTIAALLEAQSEVDRRLLAVVCALNETTIAQNVEIHRGTRIQYERMDRLLLHLLQHQIHHRGQAHAMLSGTSVRPPQLDEFFCIGEAHLRAEEFNALGWTEETVWGLSETEA